MLFYMEKGSICREKKKIILSVFQLSVRICPVISPDNREFAVYIYIYIYIYTHTSSALHFSSHFKFLAVKRSVCNEWIK